MELKTGTEIRRYYRGTIVELADYMPAKLQDKINDFLLRWHPLEQWAGYAKVLQDLKDDMDRMGDKVQEIDITKNDLVRGKKKEGT